MAFRNLTQFNRQLDKFGRDLEQRGVLFQKKVAFLVLGAYLSNASGIRAHVGLLQLTPVDEGRAVGNYIVSVGAPVYGEVGGKFGPAGGGESNRAAAGAKATSACVRALGSLKIGQSIFITNSLPYILVLNNGSTNRVAHHMLERALDNTLQALQGEG